MNNTFKISSNFGISSFFGVWQEPVTIQTKFPLTVWYNVALNQKLFKEKINVSLRGVNFLEKTKDFKTIVSDPNFNTANIVTQIRRGAALALTWNFGKLTGKMTCIPSRLHHRRGIRCISNEIQCYTGNNFTITFGDQFIIRKKLFS